MKSILSLVVLIVLGTSCALRKTSKKASYNPVISFQDEGKVFEAKVYLPKAFKDRVPLIVIIHEWWGRTDYIMMRSEMLTQEGFATLPVDLFGNNLTASTPSEAQNLSIPFYKNPELGTTKLEKFIEEAKKNPHVDPSRIYVIGYCFGGTQALNLARSGAQVKGVVSFHGGLLDIGKFSSEIKARVLALNGLSDPMVPAKERSAFEKEMKMKKVDYKIVNYKGATHAFTNPKATEIGKSYHLPVAYNSQADKSSWQELLTFLRRE